MLASSWVAELLAVSQSLSTTKFVSTRTHHIPLNIKVYACIQASSTPQQTQTESDSKHGPDFVSASFFDPANGDDMLLRNVRSFNGIHSVITQNDRILLNWCFGTPKLLRSASGLNNLHASTHKTELPSWCVHHIPSPLLFNRLQKAAILEVEPHRAEAIFVTIVDRSV
jgi:hypothetical protein